MKALARRVACELVYRSGVLAAVAHVGEHRSHRRGRFQILVYHRVGEGADPFVPATPVQTFARHVRYLCRRFSVLSLTDLLNAARTGSIPARAMAITFDDGYEDTYRYAYPVLRRYGAPAMVYLATGLVDAGEPMWNDRVGAAIRDATCAAVDPIVGPERLPLTTPAQRVATLHRILQGLKRFPPVERDRRVSNLCQSLGADSRTVPRMLQWAQVQEMHRHGIEFGAHTVRHPILTAVGHEEARQEIVDSKRAIEAHLQCPVRHFAYPNGTRRDFDETTKALVKEAGFVSAVSTIFGTNTSATDVFELRRGGPWEPATAVFATKLWWYRRTGLADSPLPSPDQQRVASA